jgi:hypothetical protein
VSGFRGQKDTEDSAQKTDDRRQKEEVKTIRAENNGQQTTDYRQATFPGEKL